MGLSNGSAQESDMYNFEGVIENIDGTVLEFCHLKDEAVRMGVVKTFLNLKEIVIWSLDILEESYKPQDFYIQCPNCKERLQVDRIKLDH